MTVFTSENSERTGDSFYPAAGFAGKVILCLFKFAGGRRLLSNDFSGEYRVEAWLEAKPQRHAIVVPWYDRTEPEP
jgi:hypothetical protein